MTTPQKARELVERLRECPFCGGPPFAVESLHGDFFVACENNDCRAMVGHLDTADDAHAAWNRRATPQDQAGEMVERCAALCEQYAAAAGTSDEHTERPFEDGMTLAGYTLAGMIRDRLAAPARAALGMGEKGSASHGSF